MIYAKQSTAITLLIGPFVDSTDGNTAETALTISQADVRLSKNGANTAQKNQATSCTHDELGYYTCLLDTTDTNTLGILKLMVHESGALPVWVDIHILTANVYDTLFSTDQLDVNVTNVAGTAQTGNDNGADINAILTDTGTTIPGTITTMQGNVTDILTDTGTTIPGTITTIDGIVDDILVDTGTTLPDQLDSMSGATFITGTDSLEAIRNRGDAAWVTGAGGSSPTVEEIRIEMDSNSTQLSAIVLDTGTTLPGEHAALATEAKQDTIDGIVDTILIDTNELQTNQGAWATATGFATSGALTTHDGKLDTVDGIVDAILVDTSTTLPAEHGALATEAKQDIIDTNVDAVLVDTGTTIPGTITTMQGNVTDIVADTNELQGDWANGGRLDLILDATLAMLDAARAEPGQGNPAVNPDAMTKIDYLYKAWRNKKEQTATEFSIYNDAGAVKDQKSTVSDDGTTATVGEIGTGA